MKVAVMQPYFFPYLGYFQLMSAVDTFVFLDDAQYMKGGWIARNRIALGGQVRWWTRPVLRDRPLEAPILDRTYSRHEDARLLARLESAYAGSEHGREVQGQVQALLYGTEDNVARFNRDSVLAIATALGCQTTWHEASRLGVPVQLRGQQRILEICRSLGATHYVNAIGGVGLYDTASFKTEGIALSFLRTTAAPEVEPTGAGLLSIVHELATRGLEATRMRLREYRLCDRTEALGATT